jgi:CubicO group peptidase (beta-lactamase class C family)
LRGLLERAHSQWRKCGTGSQLSVIRDGECRDVSFGSTSHADPMLPSHVHPAYCMTKPLIALGIGHLIDAGRIALDTRVVDVLEDPPCYVGTASVGALLCHDAGLGTPDALTWRIAPPGDRESLLRRAAPCADPACYSEIAAGIVLRALIGTIEGARAEDFLLARVLTPMGLQDEILVTAAAVRRARDEDRARVPVGVAGTRRWPLASELLDQQLDDVSAAFGGFTTARAMARLLAALGQVLDGSRVAGMPRPSTVRRLVAWRRGRKADGVLQRVCDFSAGFQVGMADHRISNLASRETVGHVAGAASGTVMFDPARQLSLALYFNGVTLGDEEAIALPRTFVIDEMLERVDSP